MPLIRVHDVGIYYEERGSGSPILFQHGYNGSHDGWEGVVQRLQDRFRCIVLDARGAGDSEHPEGGYTIEQYGEDVLGVADALGLDRFTYVGHSMGGGIGMWLGLERAHRLERLVLVAPIPAERSPGIPGEYEITLRQRRERAREEMIRERISQFARPERADEQAVARGVDRALSTSDGHFRDSGRSMMEFRVRERLGEITTPTLMIAGAADWLLPDNLTDFQLLGNATLHVFTRVGHGIPREVPAALARVLADFIEHGVVNAATLRGWLEHLRAASA